MKISSLWASVDDSTGNPVLKPELERASQPELKAQVRKYLDGGTVVLRAPGMQEDYIDPGRGRCVPIAFFTDGDWVWSAEQGYYLTAHDVLPESEFVDHMSEHGFTPEKPSPGAVREAADLLAP